MRVNRLVLLIVGCMVGVATGCATVSEPVEGQLTEADRVIFVQGTSGGISWGEKDIGRGLTEAGYHAQVVAHRWHRERPPAFPVLTRREYELVQEGAQSLADRIIALTARPPTRVYIIAQSAGCEVARIALGLLPRSVRVENVVLCGPSISPAADFSEALPAVSGKVYYQCSWVDFGMLGIGTSIIGSSDRKQGPCAGAVGFKLPADIDEEGERLYEERLVEVPWRLSFALRGFFGDHFSQQSLAHIVTNVSRMLAGDWLAEPRRPFERAEPEALRRPISAKQAERFSKLREAEATKVLKKFARGINSPEAETRREHVVKVRAYASGDEHFRAQTKDLLIGALGDGDEEVRRLAALGLIAYKRDDGARRAVESALGRAEGKAERETLADVLSRFR